MASPVNVDGRVSRFPRPVRSFPPQAPAPNVGGNVTGIRSHLHYFLSHQFSNNFSPYHGYFSTAFRYLPTSFPPVIHNTLKIVDKMGIAPMNISLRFATEDDLDLLDSIHTLCMRPHVERLYPWQPDFFRMTFDPSITRVIMIDGAVAGMLKVSTGEEGVHLHTIVLLPEYRNQGIGGGIIAPLLEGAAEEGMPVRLQVLKGNIARRLYERLGFRVVGETATHDRMEWREGGRESIVPGT